MSDETELADIPESTSSNDTGSQESSAPAPSQPASSPQASAPAPDVWSSFRSLPDFKGKDDREIAGRLYAAMQREQSATKALAQYQQLIPYGQEYLRYRESGEWDRFQKWQQSQQQGQRQPRQAPPQQSPQQDAAKGWWNPPQVRESSMRWLVRDENGREQIHPDAPMHVREELYEYQKYRTDFAQKFLSNPQEALGPMVQSQARQIADQIVQQRLEEVSQVGYVNSLEKDNADWLYEGDGKTPSREGLMIQRYISDAERRGIVSPNDRWDYACDMLERDLLAELRDNDAQLASRRQFASSIPQAPVQEEVELDDSGMEDAQAPAQIQAERDMNYLRREASRNPSRSSGAPGRQASEGPMTFEQRLRAQLARDGLA
jgi:hypothetical protein